jgi:hypothetical protein
MRSWTDQQSNSTDLDVLSGEMLRPYFLFFLSHIWKEWTALDSVTLLREESTSELEGCQRRIIELQEKLGRFDASSNLLARSF